MEAVEFATVFARLLRDGRLRDAFVAEPEAVAARMGVCGADRAALLALDPGDLEFQARVLLGKRWAAARRIIPGTCRRLGDVAGSLFCDHARNHWPDAVPADLGDALSFCAWLVSSQPRAVEPSEWNRLRFLRSRGFLAVHVLRGHGVRRSTAVQILCGWMRSRPCELVLHARF